MAEVVNGFDGLTSRRRYPWDKWLDGQVWRIDRGVDFSCTAHAFQCSVRARAHRCNESIVTRRIGDSVFIQMQGKKD